MDNTIWNGSYINISFWILTVSLWKYQNTETKTWHSLWMLFGILRQIHWSISSDYLMITPYNLWSTSFLLVAKTKQNGLRRIKNTRYLIRYFNIFDDKFVWRCYMYHICILFLYESFVVYQTYFYNFSATPQAISSLLHILAVYSMRSINSASTSDSNWQQ